MCLDKSKQSKRLVVCKLGIASVSSSDSCDDPLAREEVSSNLDKGVDLPSDGVMAVVEETDVTRDIFESEGADPREPKNG